IGYGLWVTRRMFSISAAAVITQNFLKTFLDTILSLKWHNALCMPLYMGTLRAVLPPHRDRDNIG
ncbi:MAG: hypothetical protein MUO68_00340, partial [Desulfobacteraceae bacterium]|nr:hypothetical protein [Desulfobacteraceae bacterium]